MPPKRYVQQQLPSSMQIRVPVNNNNNNNNNPGGYPEDLDDDEEEFQRRVEMVRAEIQARRRDRERDMENLHEVRQQQAEANAPRRQRYATQAPHQDASSRGTRVRNWVFTSSDLQWNPAEDEGYLGPFERGYDPAVIGYISAQIENSENASATNMQRGLHWQGYVEFNEPVSAQTAARLLAIDPGKSWFAVRRGTQAQAIAYTQKEDTAVEGTLFEWGEKKPPDAPTSYQDAIRMVQEGASLVDVVRQHTGVVARNFNGFAKTIALLAEPKKHRPQTIRIFWGETGGGKSTLCRTEAAAVPVNDQNEPMEIYEKPKSEFWEHYTKQRGLVFNEFPPEKDGRPLITMVELLKILDPDPLLLEIKGSHGHANWDHIWITSNNSPYTWYPKASEMQMRALVRKVGVNNCIKFVANPDASEDTPFEDRFFRIPGAWR